MIASTNMTMVTDLEAFYYAFYRLQKKLNRAALLAAEWKKCLQVFKYTSHFDEISEIYLDSCQTLISFSIF